MKTFCLDFDIKGLYIPQCTIFNLSFNTIPNILKYVFCMVKLEQMPTCPSK